ncbi:CitMHS family citrate-Mg2+:H+ or citrate-Ca2+:H+ symporter [Novosphingobium kunmingense]|uniref:CitMHS family citrate-Mg2+:H+ or citrate-Ca2+:H+ symporter n=1 Tax=Novosphingobium kunmingense TaxID=1211806 RepID=A0A2N0H3Q3_9SPHN|nr:citrate:proton symporter [Novosphingobium kunmingense]PKB13520.1 CitMHS family citrate-Mg2+:H+ or citrate-Ca2+:H+ symporter [Novosphingobium kunmingense]
MSTLALLGFVTIGLFLGLTLVTRLPVISALILVPAATAVAGGFSEQLGTFALDGLKTVTPIAAMIFFAVLYFGLMLDKGLFEPMIGTILRLVRDDPLRLCVATVVLPMLVALDGDGTTTFLISVTALLPVHRRLEINPLILPCLVGLAAGVMNMLPWGGPTARAMAVLKSDISGIFTPVAPAMMAGMTWVVFVAIVMGLRERKRLAGFKAEALNNRAELNNGEMSWRFWFNLVLTLLVVAALFRDLYSGTVPLPPIPSALVFMLAFAVALPVNCLSVDEQANQLATHAPSVVNVTAMILAAGIFTGVLNGSGMTKAMAEMLAGNVPQSLAPWLGTMVALTSMPLSFVLPPDAYYFGVLPVFANTAVAMGQDPLVIGRGAILGQMTTGFPLSPLTAATFVLVGLSGVSLRAHQRFTFKWALGTTIIMTLVSFALGVI